MPRPPCPKSTAFVLSTALLTAACGGDSPHASSLATSTVRDSAGVTIVENAALLEDASLGWTIGPSPVVEIGVLDGPEEYQLFRVRDARWLTDGRIAVVNAGSQEIRIYGADGIHLATWGGRGEGPGEFIDPTTISWWPGDSVAVWDRRLRRLSIFAEDGALGRTLVFPSIEGMPTPLFSHVQADGHSVVRMTVLPPEGPPRGLSRQPVAAAVVDPDGALRAGLGTHPGREAFMRISKDMVSIFAVPFYRDVVFEAAGRNSIISPTDRLEFSFWASDGSLFRVARIAGPPRLITDAERNAELERRLAAASEEERPGVRSDFEAIPSRDTLPAFTDVVVDHADYVWIKEFRLPSDQGPIRWIVLDPEGQALGRVTLPEGLIVYEISEDYVLGRATDEFEVEQIQVWPLHRY